MSILALWLIPGVLPFTAQRGAPLLDLVQIRILRRFLVKTQSRQSFRPLVNTENLGFLRIFSAGLNRLAILFTLL